MDPNATLIFIRCAIELGEFANACQAFRDLDDWIKKGGFIPREWVSAKLNQRANGEPRMSDAQRNRLWDMCGRYNVPFREDDYFPNQSGYEGPVFYEGWIGGNDHAPATLELAREKFKPTIYTGVSPEGESHT